GWSVEADDGVEMHNAAPLELANIAGKAAFSERGREHGTDDDDGGNGVGHGHERRMKRRGHVPDHVETHVDGQYENDEVDEGGTDRFHQALLKTLPSMQTRQAAMISSSCCMTSRPS